MENPMLPSGNTKKYDIPISHLDFDYIRKCQDVKELEKIYRILQSGEEGRYVALENTCEEQIKALSPNSRILRKDVPVSTKADLDKGDWQEIDSDLTSWSSDMKNMEDHLKAPVVQPTDLTEDTELPPIRSGGITLTADGAKSTQPKVNPNKRVKPREYSEWDKIDVDAELEKIDEDDNTKSKTFVANKEVTNIADVIDAKGLTESERLIRANREKDKGNEAFRAGDFKEAIVYYSRSISLQSTAASYNNRALAYLKTSDWMKTITDTDTVLKMEPENIKAWLRRGTARKGLKQYRQATEDLDTVLELEPNNKKAKELMEEIGKAVAEKKKKGRRMVIEDVDGTDEDTGDSHNTADNSANKGNNSASNDSKHLGNSRRMKIEEVDSDGSDNEIENTDVAGNLANGHDESLVNGIVDGNGGSDKNIWDADKVENDDKISAKTNITKQNVSKHSSKSSTGTGVNDSKSRTPDLPDKKQDGAKHTQGITPGITGQNKSNFPKTETSPFKPVSPTDETLVKEKSDVSDNIQNIETSGVNQEQTMQGSETDTIGSNLQTAMASETAEDSKENSGTDSDESDAHASIALEKGDPNKEGSRTNSTVSNTQTALLPVEAVTMPLQRPVFYQKPLPADCINLREDGNNKFRSGQYAEASLVYAQLVQKLETDETQVLNLSLIYSNRAACRLKMGELAGSVQDCTRSLLLVPHQVKPLLRRATAYEHLERYQLAYCDNRHVLLLDSYIDQAHLGTKRCQQMLNQKDGARWREKLKLPSVSPWEIPEIVDINSKPSMVSQLPSPTQTQSIPAPKAQEPNVVPKTEKVPEPQPIHNIDKIPEKSSPSTVEEKLPPAPKPAPAEKLTPEQKFEELKAKGNDHVKQGKFRDAVSCYSECITVLPSNPVSYTNRALCYIRLNQPENASSDCSHVLSTDPDNVKALFRRAQARKMLKQYREGIEDLKHLLETDPGNSAAKKEMELLKNYWREELQSMKRSMPSPKPATSQPEPGSKHKPGTSHTEPGSKNRKRMVIEEVDSDEDDTKSGPSIQKTSPKSPTNRTSKSKLPDSPQKSHHEQHKTTNRPSQRLVEEIPGKKDGKLDGRKSDTKRHAKSAEKKSTLKETSSGLPKVPHTAPKLEKATPYEFISAWNALKKSDSVKPYYDLLKQISPQDIKTVISNKLDGDMLNVITRCVVDHYLPSGDEDESYQVLKNVSTLPRFSTVSMFMSSAEKGNVKYVLDTLEGRKSAVYSRQDIQKLKKDYSIK